MSMTTFMMLQMIGIFCAYFGVTLILPLVVFRRILKAKSITNQILFSFLIGNFYIITMVQILQLLKISHTITLILATAVPAYIVWVKLNNVKVRKIAGEAGTNVKRLVQKHLGIKTVIWRIYVKVRRFVRKSLLKIGRLLRVNWIEIILQVTLLTVLVCVYGIGIVQQYGYSASDLPVHNYWINAMSDNNIFVAGVYPHGYHCMIYYLHETFGFDTYIILSLFAFIQIIGIHFALLYFLRLSCKTKYISYIGVILYAGGNFFTTATYSRFASTLPQEFGMIFIFPSIYYGFEFFKLRYEEVKAKEKKKESWYSLFGFAMSFGLTLSAHFYNTIIAGIFCVAMAIGYLFLFVRKQYFGNVVITCFVSVIVAILPMVIAFATGTPLQGSLYWATNVIMGEDEEAESIEQNVVSDAEVDSNSNKQPQAATDIHENRNEVGKETEKEIFDEDVVQVSRKSFKEVFSEKIHDLKSSISKMNRSMKNNVWAQEEEWHVVFFWGTIVFLILMGIMCILFKRTCYGAMLISDAIYMVLMAVLLASGSLGIPRLMDPARSCIYFAYSLPILLVMPLDAIIGIVPRKGMGKRISEAVSLSLLFVFVAYLLGSGHVRNSFTPGVFETNEAVTCLTNIIQQEDDFTWTICSANDELRMGEDHGYHYETITFLKKMENWSKDTIITMPTPKVYFFVEKIPLDYAVKYKGSGQTISEEGAKGKLSYSNSLAPYQGENRWITMSRMYYWAQEFQKMYPNEMRVYMETDRFVCYVIEQNTYSLYNFAIDYGFNTRE